MSQFGTCSDRSSTPEPVKQMSEFWTTGRGEQQSSDEVVFPNWGKVARAIALWGLITELCTDYMYDMQHSKAQTL
ncbi:hypothetical protein NDA01_29720 [Trichocoleus desertorum AS-A10]|uniref:hypothetical protein n=1 Tax=Trichocoleus desertorum TaxID=1481672 RepID=UPI00329912DA